MISLVLPNTVVIDHRQNRNASTGMFELMYQHTTTPMPMNPVGSIRVDVVISERAIKREIDNISLKKMQSLETKKTSFLRSFSIQVGHDIVAFTPAFLAVQLSQCCAHTLF